MPIEVHTQLKEESDNRIAIANQDLESCIELIRRDPSRLDIEDSNGKKTIDS